MVESTDNVRYLLFGACSPFALAFSKWRAALFKYILRSILDATKERPCAISAARRARPGRAVEISAYAIRTFGRTGNILNQTCSS